MNRLANIPIKVWYLFSVVYCYMLWNPYYSLWSFVQGAADPALKAIAIILAVIIAALYLIEGHRSMNVVGIVLFLSLTGAVMWLAFNHGARFNYAELWGQWVVGAFMTLALQGGRIYRSMTGRVPVTGTVEHDTAGHHHG